MSEQLALTLGNPKVGISLGGGILHLKDPQLYIVEVPRGTFRSIRAETGITHYLLYIGRELFIDPAGKVVKLGTRYYLWSDGRFAYLRVYGTDYLFHPFIGFRRLANLIGLRHA